MQPVAPASATLLPQHHARMRQNLFCLASLAAKQQKRCSGYTEVPGRFQRVAEAKSSPVQGQHLARFPGRGLGSDTFVIVDAHVHVPVVRSLLVKVCQEKESPGLGGSCGSWGPQGRGLAAQLSISSDKTGRKWC